MKIILSATFVNTTKQWPISVNVAINNVVIWAKSVITSEDMQLEINDVVACNQVKITFAGKTQVDNSIASQTAIVINNIKLQGVDIEPVLQKIATYRHNTNGYTDSITAEYTNFVGFDGVIEFNLDTPVSNWFYKNYAW